MCIDFHPWLQSTFLHYFCKWSIDDIDQIWCLAYVGYTIDFFSLLIYTSKDVNVLQCLLWVYKTRTTCKNKSPVRNCFKYSVHCLHKLLLWKWDRLKAQVFKANLDKLLFDWNFVYKVRCVYIQSINHYKDSRFCTKRLHLWRHDDLKKWIYMLIELLMEPEMHVIYCIWGNPYDLPCNEYNLYRSNSR